MEDRSANAIRIARYRERQRNGRFVLTIEADEIELVDLLIAQELLSENLADDKSAIQEATTKMLELILTENMK
jgi:hypothetical protein